MKRKIKHLIDSSKDMNEWETQIKKRNQSIEKDII